MTAPMTLGLRRTLAALLIITLTLAGLGRAVATTSYTADRLDVVAGLHVPICHTGADTPSSPASPAHPAQHDCCDACALLAATILPAGPVLSGPAPAGRFTEHVRAVARVMVIGRPRSPRQSRGPPTA